MGELHNFNRIVAWKQHFLRDLLHDFLTFFCPVEVEGQEDDTAHQVWDGVEEFVLDGLVVGGGGGGLQGGVVIVAKGESGDNYR